MGRSIIPVSKRHFPGPMTALFNVMETAVFYRQCLKINNATVKEYCLTKFCGSLQNPMHKILLGCVEIWHIYLILSIVYFSDTV